MIKSSWNNYGHMKKLIYIAGSGKSGSTLLDIILGSNENAFSIGELNFLFRKGLIEKEYCTCKAIVKDCEIWKEVLSIWNKKASMDQKEYRQFQIYYESKKQILKLLKELKNPSTKFTVFLNDTKILYETISKVTKCEILIDSSKSVARALILSKIYTPDNLIVVHLIKRFSHVLNSNKKIVKKDIKSGIEFSRGERSIFYVFYFLKIWLLENLILFGFFNKKRIVVPFENYIKNPDSIIMSAHGKIEIKTKIYNPKHMMAGNHMRMKKNIEINNDILNKPLSNLNRIDKSIGYLIDSTFYKFFV